MMVKKYLLNFCLLLFCFFATHLLVKSNSNNYSNSNIQFKNESNSLKLANGFDAHFLSTADIDNDGLSDLIVQSIISGETMAYENANGSFNYLIEFSAKQENSIAWNSYLDVDAEGIADKIGYQFEYELSFKKGYLNNNKLSFNNSSALVFSADFPVFDPLDKPIFIDEDKNGDFDSLAGNAIGTKVNVLPDNGTNNYNQEHII